MRSLALAALLAASCLAPATVEATTTAAPPATTEAPAGTFAMMEYRFKRSADWPAPHTLADFTRDARQVAGSVPDHYTVNATILWDQCSLYIFKGEAAAGYTGAAPSPAALASLMQASARDTALTHWLPAVNATLWQFYNITWM